MKYINADDLIEKVRKSTTHSGSEWFVNKIINTMPSADVVEVVRCKDCVYFCPNNFRKCKLLWEHREENDFCSRGERKETE